jgi:hypothetical protein
MKWRYSMHLFASLGDLWLVRGDLAKAQESAAQCLQNASRTNARKYLIKGWLCQAMALAQVVGNPTQLWKTPLALGRLHAETRRPEQARQEYSAAREVIDRMIESLQEPGLRTSLTHMQQRILLKKT